MRPIHRGTKPVLKTLPLAVIDVVLKPWHVTDARIIEALRLKVMGLIEARLGRVTGATKLYDFNKGVPLFGFLHAFMEKEVLRLLKLKTIPWEELPPPGIEDLVGAEERALEAVDRHRMSDLWRQAVLTDAALYPGEKLLLARIGFAVASAGLTETQESKLARALFITGRSHEGEAGHCVYLYSGVGGLGEWCETPIRLATILRNDTEARYGTTNASSLTGQLPKWLENAVGLLHASLTLDDRRMLGKLAGQMLTERRKGKERLERFGHLRNELGEPGFSLEKWLGPPRIEVGGRVAGCGLPDSGYGIAQYDHLFGLVPPDSPAVKALLSAAGDPELIPPEEKDLK